MDGAEARGRARLGRARAADLLGGAILIVLGAAIAIASRTTLALGTLDHMGPGFFPMCLGCVLALLGVAIVARPSGAAAPLAVAAGLEWRGWLCIVGGIVAFLLIGQHLGLVPATFAIVFLSALGDRQNSVRDAFLLAIAMVAICVVIFAWALQIQFPLVKWG